MAEINNKSLGYPLFSFAYCGDFDSMIANLAKLAAPEAWTYRQNPSPKPMPILYNYLHYTFSRVWELRQEAETQGKNIDEFLLILPDKQAATFNTGLFTANFEAIYAFFLPNNIPDKQEWKLIGFCKTSDSSLQRFNPLPKRARYFSHISDLIFDTSCDIRVNIDHILNDPENIQRLPHDLQAPEKQALTRNLLKGALDTAIKQVEANYQTAVPQYYKGNIQLLIPLSLYGDLNNPEVALAIFRSGDSYAGRTCLTLDMAYNNARLIVKPTNSWIRAEIT